MRLAERGAVYSAEEEFLQTLQLIAHQNDARGNTQAYSEALAAGLRALKEADAFSAALKNPAASRNVKSLVAAHKTPVLANVSDEAVPALQALQQYYDFAQQKIRQAVGQDSSASDVLYGLAKVYIVQAKSEDESAAIAKAIASLQLALDVNSSNYRAANELGVLLARCGRLEQSKRVLLQGLSASEQPETWRNLSKVHARLGETDLAQRAEHRCQVVTQQRASESQTQKLGSQIRWVDTTTFVEGSARGVGADSPALRRESTTTVARNTESEKRPSGLDHLKSMFRFKKSSPERSPSPDGRVSHRSENHSGSSR